MNKAYLDFDNITGNCRVHLDSHNELLKLNEIEYCNNPHPCWIWDVKNIIYPPDVSAEILVTTYVNEKLQLRKCQLNEDCAPTNAFKTISTKEYFVAEVEKHTFRISHNLRSFEYCEHSLDDCNYAASNNQMNGRITYDDKNGNPKDIFFGTEDDYSKGDPIPLEILLEAAGINLNETLPEYDKPIRETGAYIFLTILGENTQHCFWAPCTKRYRYEIMKSTQSVTEAKSTEIIKSITDRDKQLVLERHGIKIIVQFGGEFGRFDFMVLLLSIVGGLALFSMATVFTDFLLMYVMPLRSYYAADKYEYTRDYSDLRDEHTLIRQETERNLLKLKSDTGKDIYLDRLGQDRSLGNTKGASSRKKSPTPSSFRKKKKSSWNKRNNNSMAE